MCALTSCWSLTVMFHDYHFFRLKFCWQVVALVGRQQIRHRVMLGRKNKFPHACLKIFRASRNSNPDIMNSVLRNCHTEKSFLQMVGRAHPYSKWIYDGNRCIWERPSISEKLTQMPISFRSSWWVKLRYVFFVFRPSIPKNQQWRSNFFSGWSRSAPLSEMDKNLIFQEAMLLSC